MHPFPTCAPLQTNAMASAEATREPELRSPFSASVVRRAADLRLAERQAFVDRLRDPRARFTPEDTLTLLTLLREAASSSPSATTWPSVVWCQPGQPIQTRDAQAGRCVLVAPFSTNTGWELHSAVTAVPCTEPLSLPAHVPHFNQFRCRSHDIFDVIMQTLHSEELNGRWVSSGQPPAVDSPPGLPLRLALAQWLETHQQVRRPTPCRQPTAMSLPPPTARGMAYGTGVGASASLLGRSRFPPSLGHPLLARLGSGPQVPSQLHVQGPHGQIIGDPPHLRFNGLTIDRIKGNVMVGACPVHLTKAEYLILLTLTRTPGRAVTRQALKEILLPYKLGTAVRAVDQHVRRMREKFQAADPHHDWIATVWGNGYQFMDRPT